MTEVERMALRRLLGPDAEWLKTTRPRKGPELTYTECTWMGCPFRSGSRRDEEVALEDILRHVRQTHDTYLRKHERDVEHKLERERNRR